MVDRAALRRAFLEQAGWGSAERRVLADDASFRRYDRLTGDAGRAVLMDAPPPQEDTRPFARIAGYLHRLGLSAPQIYAHDVEAGFMLLEDFGDMTFTRALAEGLDEKRLYRLAVDLLVQLHRRWDSEGVAQEAKNLPPYDEARYLQEALLLTDWYWPAIFGSACPKSVREQFESAWKSALPAADAVPTTLVLRDFHVDNLILLEGREGVSACGLLDFQDAVLGPRSYDLVSLLEDARRDIDATLAQEMCRRYLDAFPEVDDQSFRRSYAILGAQRSTKIIGIFTRLLVRDSKGQYLRHIPRVWRILAGDLEHPALAGLSNWFEEHFPPDCRRTPVPSDGKT
jgi:aminoglycoside/choline kinase family phosphotransferase